MSLSDRFRGRQEPPPSLPAVPVDGTVESFDAKESLGAIRLVTGDSAWFGKSACSFEPVVGLAVRVLAVEIRPRGKIRATRVELRVSVVEHLHLLDERDRANGLGKPDSSWDRCALSIFQLSATTMHPIRGRTALYAFWERSGCGERARLEFAPDPVAFIADGGFQLFLGTVPPDAVVDARHRPDGAPLGAGFVAFWDGSIPRLARVPGVNQSFWGFRPGGHARLLLELMTTLARYRDEVTGVVIGAAGALWLPAEEWLQRAGDPHDPDNIPVEAFLDVAYGPTEGGIRRLRSFGMMSLGLPEVEVDDPLAADDDARHALCENVVWHACRRLAGEDALREALPEVSLPAGGNLTFRGEDGVVSYRVVGYTDATHDMLRLAGVTVLDGLSRARLA